MIYLSSSSSSSCCCFLFSHFTTPSCVSVAKPHAPSPPPNTPVHSWRAIPILIPSHLSSWGRCARGVPKGCHASPRTATLTRAPLSLIKCLRV
ncbi:hypothetical protein E2C01_071543 [Portunus trituberculatus]|uniref:Uncharacterized protein n=1 Tax=Portunus trituberculatus TaxID=210409 RepID=A0A5B7I896_PORTR|nr:hypothetical protein [Portunus trituberculatus]